MSAKKRKTSKPRYADPKLTVKVEYDDPNDKNPWGVSVVRSMDEKFEVFDIAYFSGKKEANAFAKNLRAAMRLKR